MAHGYNLFIFDYPGYGLSQGSPSPYHCLISGHAAMEWVHKTKDPDRLLSMGNRFGGIVALRSVLDKKDEVPIRHLVVDSSFSSFQSIGRQKLSLSWLTWPFQFLPYLLLSDRYAPKDLSPISPIPVLVIHGHLIILLNLILAKKYLQSLKIQSRFGEFQMGTMVMLTGLMSLCIEKNYLIGGW